MGLVVGVLIYENAHQRQYRYYNRESLILKVSANATDHALPCPFVNHAGRTDPGTQALRQIMNEGPGTIYYTIKILGIAQRFKELGIKA